MSIYALFLCVAGQWGTCTMQGQARMTFAGPMPATTYRTLEDCQAFAKSIAPSRVSDNRYELGIDHNMWFECRSRHVDTWEAPPPQPEPNQLPRCGDRDANTLVELCR